MRTLMWAVTVVVSLSGVSCTIVADDYSPESIVALERGALDRWGKGDPKGYYELMAAGETYFDPTTAKRIDGIEALKAHFAPFDGKIAIDRYEMINPKVQRDGNIAVLTFNLDDSGARIAGVEQGTQHWNSTEVFQRFDGKWKIIHSHWSYTKPQAGDDTQAVRTLHVNWAKAWAAKDVDAIVNHYADDAYVELANTPIVHGKAAIRAGVARTFADPDFALMFAPDQVEVSKGSDFAYVRGTYTTRFSDSATKRPVTSKGKYIVVYRGDGNGHWQAIHDINNRDSR
jgi:ketosteroid isomerase-like protein